MDNGCKSAACRDLIYYGQSKRFYETYKIDSKDLMYIEPEKRVNIWS